MFTLLFLLFLTIHSSVQAKVTENLDQLYLQYYNLRSVCDFSYAEPYDRINPADVFPGATIFMTGHTINRFFKEINPHIKNPYIIVDMFGGLALHDGTTNMHPDDPKVLAAFGNDAGLIEQHPKFTMMPIGIFRDSAIAHNQGTWNAFFKEMRNKPKQDKVYMNFTLHNWSDWRKELYNLHKDKPWVAVSMGRKDFRSYMQEMAEYKFAFSPVGDMHDCYRHWEAIMVGVIPIMIAGAPIAPLFDDLPVLLVNSWDEITPELLEQKYKEIMAKSYNLEKLYLKYWVDQINAVKKAHGY